MVDVRKLYVTPDYIRRIMGVSKDDYPDDLIVPYIEEAMGIVDRWTSTAWNGRTVETEERHDLTKYVQGIIWGAGIRIKLGYYPIREITELKVFMGTGYQNWVETYPCEDPTGDGRGHCLWWYDAKDAEVYIQTFVLKWGGREVIVRYRFGRDDLDPRVKRFVRLYVERELLLRDMTYVAVPEMSKGISLEISDRIKMLNQLINDVKYQLVSPKPATNNSFFREIVDGQPAGSW